MVYHAAPTQPRTAQIMAEINAIQNQLDDLQGRTTALRGYL